LRRRRLRRGRRAGDVALQRFLLRGHHRLQLCLHLHAQLFADGLSPFLRRGGLHREDLRQRHGKLLAGIGAEEINKGLHLLVGEAGCPHAGEIAVELRAAAHHLHGDPVDDGDDAELHLRIGADELVLRLIGNCRKHLVEYASRAAQRDQLHCERHLLRRQFRGQDILQRGIFSGRRILRVSRCSAQNRRNGDEESSERSLHINLRPTATAVTLHKS